MKRNYVNPIVIIIFIFFYKCTISRYISICEINKIDYSSLNWKLFKYFTRSVTVFYNILSSLIAMVYFTVITVKRVIHKRTEEVNFQRDVISVHDSVSSRARYSVYDVSRTNP